MCKLGFVAVGAVLWAACGPKGPAPGALGAAATAHTDDAGTTIWYAGDAPVAEYFRTHQVMVTEVFSATPSDTGWVVETWYPSINHGGEGEQGAETDTVLYPHEVSVGNPLGVPVDPAALDRKTTMLVLQQADGDFAWDLLGTAPWVDSLDMRWFEGKPDYRYAP